MDIETHDCPICGVGCGCTGDDNPDCYHCPPMPEGANWKPLLYVLLGTFLLGVMDWIFKIEILLRSD